MRYFVTIDPQTGARRAAGVARLDERDRVQVYQPAVPGWVDAPPHVHDGVTSARGWAPLPENEVEAALAGLQVEPGYWLTVTHTDNDPKLLVRSPDGRLLEGYAVSSARWEPMQSPATPALHDPARWQPVDPDDVTQLQGWLHLQWDLKQAAAFDAQAPELIDTDLTELAVRQGITAYIIDILKLLPDGLTVGFQRPDRSGATGRCGSGPLGPKGSWNFQVGYAVWGFPEGAASDAVFDAFKRLFDTWGWTYRYDVTPRRNRHVDARTSKKRKHAYHVTVSRYHHGGVSMTWTSPYYPGKFADPDLDMPSAITKHGIQHWDPPVYKDRPDSAIVRPAKPWPTQQDQASG